MSLIGQFMAASPFTTAFLRGDDLPNAWGPTGSPVYSDAEGALVSSAVFSCIRVLTEDIGALPIHVYRRLPNDDKVLAKDHYLYPVLHSRPNPEMTNVNYYSAMIGHTELRGNHFSQIIRDGYDRPIRLIPLRPDKMSVGRSADDGRILYQYRLVNGSTRTFEKKEILHVRNLSPDGLIGYSTIALLQQAIGLSINMETYGMKLFTHGARPDGIVTMKGRLSANAREEFKAEWNQMHRGERGLAVFEDGASWQSVGMPPEESQFLASRKYQKTEIAGIYRVPAHKIGEMDRATFANVEAMAIDYVASLLPRLVNIEAEMQAQLFPEGDDEYFAEFNVDALLRGNASARFAVYAIAKQWGIYSTNRILAKENENRVDTDGADDLYMPVNMVKMGTSTMPPNAQQVGSGGMGGSVLGGDSVFNALLLQRVEALEAGMSTNGVHP